jgi:protein gp37
MSANSKIEWTEHTFNPWWGCSKVSPGCANCYAESFSKRVGFKIWGQDAERRYFGDKHWSEPVKWDREAAKLGVMHRVFCGSMCDIFEDRPGLEDPRLTVFDLAEATPNLLWLFLTKRPQNANDMIPSRWRAKWPRNAMLGVTIEDQPRLEERMPYIAALSVIFPGIKVFASCEPLLSALDWHDHWLEHFVWIIGGGESGHHARPMHPDWIRKLRNDCESRRDMGRPWPLPFLFKQWGEYCQWSQTTDEAAVRFGAQPDRAIKLGKRDAGRLLDGRTWDGIPILTYGPQLPGVTCCGAEAHV